MPLQRRLVTKMSAHPLAEHKQALLRVVAKTMESNRDRIEALERVLSASPDNDFADHYRSSIQRLREEIYSLDALEAYLNGKIHND
jgi:hypothetical protein